MKRFYMPNNFMKKHSLKMLNNFLDPSILMNQAEYDRDNDSWKKKKSLSFLTSKKIQRGDYIDD